MKTNYWELLSNVTPRIFLSAVAVLALAAVGVSARAAELAGWDVFGSYYCGVSPLTPSTAAANLTIVGLTRGSGVSTTASASANAWGGVGLTSTGEAAAITADKFVTFSLTANAGSTFSCTTIPAYNIRRSASGSTTGIWQYQVGTGAFTEIGSAITWGTVTTATGNPKSAIDLSGITALQNVATGTTITFRLVLWGASGSTGTWYINDLAVTGDDLQVQGTVTSTIITPTITGAATATAFTTTYGTASAAQTFAVAGAGLTANIIATTPTGFEVASDGATYGSTATFTQSGGSASGTLSVRLATTAAVAGTYNSQNIVLTSAGAAAVNIATAASGDGVSPAAITITANADGKTYGDTKTSYGSGSGAYVLSGGLLKNSDAISTVTLTDTDGGGAPTAAAGGTYHLTPSAAVFTTGSGANYTITYTLGLLTVGTKTASVTAAAKSKSYGAVNPALTATVAGTVNGDTLNYTLATGATQFSGVGTANITVTLGSNPNYSVLTTNSTLNISPATPTFNLVSSANPSGFNSNVTFAANTILPADVTGTIQFTTNGANFGSAVTFSSGSAVSPGTASLPRSTTNGIQAIYSGDANYLPITNTLTQTVTNHPPVVNNHTYSRAGMSNWKIAVSDLLTNTSDADGDAVTLVGLGASTNGVVLDTNSTPGYVQYYGTNAVDDQFTCTVTDGHGGTNTFTITLAFNPAGSVTGTNSIAKIVCGNPTTLTAYGVVNYSYIAQRSTDLANWTDIQTNCATNGVIRVSDCFGDLGGQAPASAYYRLKWVGN